MILGVTPKLYSCPLCGHPAILHKAPDEFAGMLECMNDECGSSEYHEHSDYRIETDEVTFFPTPDIDASYEVEYYVCGECGAQIDIDEASPAEDRAEAEADYAQDDQ